MQTEKPTSDSVSIYTRPTRKKALKLLAIERGVKEGRLVGEAVDIVYGADLDRLERQMAKGSRK